jgi:hypothetical protein
MEDRERQRVCICVCERKKERRGKEEREGGLTDEGLWQSFMRVNEPSAAMLSHAFQQCVSDSA